MEHANYVLIIESDSGRARSLTSLCRNNGYRVRFSPDPLHGLMRALIDVPAMILVVDADRWRGSLSIEAALSRSQKLRAVPCLLLDTGAPVPRTESAPAADAKRKAGWNDEAGLRAQLLILGARVAEAPRTTANSRRLATDRTEIHPAILGGRGLISASRAPAR